MPRYMVHALGVILLWTVATSHAQLASNQPTARPARSGPGPTLENCLVIVIDEAEIPAKEAGVLTELKVKEGAEVRAGDLLAQIDDRRPQIEKQLSEHEYHAATEKASNDINVRFAKAAADVAEAEYLAGLDANRRVANSVAAADIRKSKLEHRKAVLQIEQSGLEQTIARHDAEAAASKVEAADDNIRRRKVLSPISGAVIEVRRHLGEWVQAGEVVLHVVRLDHLKVEGFVKASQFRGSRIRGRTVTVEMELPGGEKRELTGRITFVNPIVQTAGDYRVWAEIENRQE
ncbi:MAG: HlyD family efflux transporter periplasmic adaptor subunit, partial [Planctomycetia bacterium]|nr:HlyD family efflux transporter periplasmic adaptor subunit [Planctomycetia bacterium]